MNTSPKIYIERLNQLVRVLREVRDEKRLFSLFTWVTTDLTLLDIKFPEGACGTVSCAVGWAAQDPWFRRRGFSLGKNYVGRIYPQYKSHKEIEFEWDAVEAFFNITNNTAYDLFSETEYPYDYTIETVIERVETYIAETYGEEALRKEITV